MLQLSPGALPLPLHPPIPPPERKFTKGLWTDGDDALVVQMLRNFPDDRIVHQWKAFLDCLITINDGTLQSWVNQKATHTDQCLLFDSHHPLDHRLVVIRTLYHCVSYFPSTEETVGKEHYISAKHCRCVDIRTGAKRRPFTLQHTRIRTLNLSLQPPRPEAWGSWSIISKDCQKRFRQSWAITESLSTWSQPKPWNIN